jgi:hypothetical protein
MGVPMRLIGPHRVAMQVEPLHVSEPCGDAAELFTVPGAPQRWLLAIVDGLGHGAEAAQAAQVAMQLIAAQPALELPAQLARLDAGLIATRGAAIGLARIDGAQLHYAGIGNTRALRWRDGHLVRLPSEPGIVGGGLPRQVPVSTIDLRPQDWVLLMTDGLDEMLQLPVRLPEWERDLDLLCAHLMAHFRNVADDAGALVFHVGADAAPHVSA